MTSPLLSVRGVHTYYGNIAALKGNRDAVRLRRELAVEMDEAEIAAAQRAAREWLGKH